MELTGKRIAALAEDMFEDLELWVPVMRLREAGARVDIIGTTREKKSYQGKHGVPIHVSLAAEDAQAGDYDGVIIPGGYAPDRLRRYEPVLDLVRSIDEAGGVVGMICHAGWVPISAGILRGKQVTSTPAIKDDLLNAGAQWRDEEVIRDGNLISSRHPGDLPAFCAALVEALGGSEESHGA